MYLIKDIDTVSFRKKYPNVGMDTKHPDMDTDTFL